MIVKPLNLHLMLTERFESSVNSYDSQTNFVIYICLVMFESSVNSYDSQTDRLKILKQHTFESSVNSYDSQTVI